VAFLLFVLACLDEPGPLLMYTIYHYLYPDGILIVLLQCRRKAIHQRHNRTPTFTGARANRLNDISLKSKRICCFHLVWLALCYPGGAENLRLSAFLRKYRWFIWRQAWL